MLTTNTTSKCKSEVRSPPPPTNTIMLKVSNSVFVRNAQLVSMDIRGWNLLIFFFSFVDFYIVFAVYLMVTT